MHAERRPPAGRSSPKFGQEVPLLLELRAGLAKEWMAEDWSVFYERADDSIWNGGDR